jgi:hypothetical protein
MKQSGLIAVLIFLYSFPLIKAQEFTNDLSLHPQDDLTVILYPSLITCWGACDGQVSAEVTGGSLHIPIYGRMDLRVP